MRQGCRGQDADARAVLAQTFGQVLGGFAVEVLQALQVEDETVARAAQRLLRLTRDPGRVLDAERSVEPQPDRSVRPALDGDGIPGVDELLPDARGAPRLRRHAPGVLDQVHVLEETEAQGEGRPQRQPGREERAQPLGDGRAANGRVDLALQGRDARARRTIRSEQPAGEEHGVGLAQVAHETLGLALQDRARGAGERGLNMPCARVTWP
jgi:hypothetical protein